MRATDEGAKSRRPGRLLAGLTAKKKSSAEAARTSVLASTHAATHEGTVGSPGARLMRI